MLSLSARLRWLGLAAACALGLSFARPAWAKPLAEADVVAAILKADPKVQRLNAQTKLVQAQMELSTPRWSPLAYYNLEHFGAGRHLEQEHELGAGAQLIAPHQKAPRDQARLQVELAKYRAKRQIHARVIQGLRRFYRIVALQEQLSVLAYWKDGLTELHRVVRARVKAGESPGYEALRIDLELKHANSEIRVAQAQQSAERRAFAGYLGLDAKNLEFTGELLPDAKALERTMGQPGERASVQALAQGRQGMAQGVSAKRSWMPGLSLNAGLRMRHLPGHQEWGFGVGLSGAFPSSKRVRAVREAAKANLDVMHSQIDAARFDANLAARRSGLLCLSLLRERTRYIAEIQSVLEPLEAALYAEYREGQRDVIGLMTVLARSMDSRRYRLALAKMAREAELDYRDARGVFEP